MSHSISVSTTMNVSSMRTRLLAAGLVLLAAACTTTKEGATRTGEVKISGPKVAQGDGKTGPQQPQISTRAKLLFEDAVKASEAQKKAGKYDFVSLERKFKAAFDEDPNLAEASYNLGVLAEMQGKKAEAVSHYQAALRKKPTLKQAAENLAVITQNEGNVQGAVQIYQQILESYPDDGSSRARLAEIYLQQGDHERAMQLAREALIREPKTLIAYKVMMRSSLERDQLSMARLVALRALKLDEADPEIYFAMGQINLKEGEREKALLQFKRAVEVRPDYLPAHNVLATMALANEDYSGAEEHLRRILQADSKNAAAHLNLGVAYKGMGQYDKALQEYEEAEKLNPDLGAIYLNKGIILAQHKGAPAQGLELYKKFVNLSGGSGVGVTSDHSVFKLIDQAQAAVQAEEEAKRAIAEAQRLEEEAKRQAEREAAEAQLKAGDKGAQPVVAAGGGDAAKKDEKKEESKDEAKKEEAKKPSPAPAPAPQPAKATASDEPSDEPSDNL